MTQQYYLHTTWKGSVQGREVVETTTEGDWMWGLSGDEYQVPKKVFDRVRQVMEKGLVVRILNKQLVFP